MTLPAGMGGIVQIETEKKGPSDRLQEASRGTDKQPLHNFADVDRLEPLLPSREFELNLFSSIETAVALFQNRRVMNENVLAVLLGDEPVALHVIEPFDCPPSHTTSSSSCATTFRGISRDAS